MKKIGIPRALLYFKYKYLWEKFFNELKFKVILSKETDKEILENGVKYSIDETCLSAKIYMGHVKYLIDKVDYIFIPRIVSLKKNECVCTKFNALYDIVNNTFENVKILDYNIDYETKNTELKAFIFLGKQLNINRSKIIQAYTIAKKYQISKEKEQTKKQKKLLEINDKLKILIVSHPYNTYDKLLGYPIIKYLKELDVLPIYSNLFDSNKMSEYSKKISPNLYWTYNKELIGSIECYKDKIDGILFLSTFPCGPDSLVNEMCIRKINNIPKSVIILDEQGENAGIYTRIESFIDILKAKKYRKFAANE